MRIFIICCFACLINTVVLNAAEPVKRNCHCKNCQCTPDAHCGCYSDEGCHCAKGQGGCGRPQFLQKQQNLEKQRLPE